MSKAVDTLRHVSAIVAAIADRPVEEITTRSRLVEDLDLDSLQVVEIAVRAEEEIGMPVDDALLTEPEMTVEQCAQVVNEAAAQKALT
ncbi:phosphopantetheine-binding protein [Streptomyces sp. NBC_00237]|uniref:acyl carrier protein n=1 Tax=Streptomyces sp. NBC_00237 TaxID=2975687 RepID=UPI002259468C|nr:phosphopantetheine-binding protein [Streptomyces sp. NBC_00237]MCX5205639.1 phosphopantetheine-binding protein [Streptomyces sp. NBC_00237]